MVESAISLWQFRLSKKSLLYRSHAPSNHGSHTIIAKATATCSKASCSKTSSSNASCIEAVLAETRDGDEIEAKLEVANAAVMLRQIRFRGTNATVPISRDPAKDDRDSTLWKDGGHQDSLDPGEDVGMERMT